MTTTTFRDSTPHLPARLGAPVAGALVLLLAGLLTAGCGEQEKKAAPKLQQFEINVSVADENDNPVPKAPVLLDGKTVGFTDADGLFEATIQERAGAEIEVAIGKMDDYLVPDDAAVSGALRLSKSLEGKKKPVPVTLQTTVRSARKDYLVWIDVDCGKYLDSAKCQNLPVMHNDKEVARTDDHGQAHFSFQAVPGNKATVKIDTPSYKPGTDEEEFVMEPADPSYDVELGLSSEVLRISEEFTDPAAAKEAKERAKRRRRYRRARRRKAAKKTTTTKKKEKKDDGVIDLW